MLSLALSCSALPVVRGWHGLLGWPADRRQDHDHVPPIELRWRVHSGQFLHVLREPLEDTLSELRVSHLPAPKHDRHLHPGPGLKEPNHMALLRLIVVSIDLRPELDLLDLDPSLPFPRFLLSDCPLVLELAVVHDPADRRIRLRGYLDQVQILLLRTPESVLSGHDPDLRPIRSHEADLGGTYTFVDAWLNRDPASPPEALRRENPHGRRKWER